MSFVAKRREAAIFGIVIGAVALSGAAIGLCQTFGAGAIWLVTAPPAIAAFIGIWLIALAVALSTWGYAHIRRSRGDPIPVINIKDPGARLYVAWVCAKIVYFLAVTILMVAVIVTLFLDAALRRTAFQALILVLLPGTALWMIGDTAVRLAFIRRR